MTFSGLLIHAMIQKSRLLIQYISLVSNNVYFVAQFHIICIGSLMNCNTFAKLDPVLFAALSRRHRQVWAPKIVVKKHCNELCRFIRFTVIMITLSSSIIVNKLKETIQKECRQQLKHLSLKPSRFSSGWCCIIRNETADLRVLPLTTGLNVPFT